jgi:putative membrane protein
MEHQTQKLRTYGHFRPHCFRGRWLQLPTYLGQIAAQAIYAYKFLKMLWHLISNLGIMDETPSCSPYSI